MTSIFVIKKQHLVFIKKIILYVVLTSTGFFLALPFLWTLLTALKEPAQIWIFPPQLIPKPFVWQNFPKAFSVMHFVLHLKNTLIVVFGSLAGVLLSCSLVAYGFARFRFPGRDILFIILLGTLMIPAQVTIIPLFIIFVRIGWVNSFKPLIVPAFFGYPFYIFLLRQFFMTIPRELDEATIIDGGSYFTIFAHVILPLCKPALAAVIIFHFIGSWNDFFGPLIYLNDNTKYTLSVALANFQGVYGTHWEWLMAASIMVALPCIVLFFFTQKFFIHGIALTGMKG